MRGLTSTLILVVVLAGLGAYIYFVDSKRPAASPDGSSAVREKVFTVEGDKVNDSWRKNDRCIKYARIQWIGNEIVTHTARKTSGSSCRDLSETCPTVRAAKDANIRKVKSIGDVYRHDDSIAVGINSRNVFSLQYTATVNNLPVLTCICRSQQSDPFVSK